MAATTAIIGAHISGDVIDVFPEGGIIDGGAIGRLNHDRLGDADRIAKRTVVDQLRADDRIEIGGQGNLVVQHTSEGSGGENAGNEENHTPGRDDLPGISGTNTSNSTE